MPINIDMHITQLFPCLETSLSHKDAGEIVADFEHSKGRIKAVCARNPWLVEACQKATLEEFGSHFSVYRGLTLTTDMRSDTIASTSTDWRVCDRIVSDAPSFIMQAGQSIRASKVVLHYQIEPANVVLWVPFAIPYVQAAIAKKKGATIEDRHGNRIKMKFVLDSILKLDEQEIVADLTGLMPKVMRFEGNLIGGERLAVFQSVMGGASTVAEIHHQHHGRWQMSDLDIEQTIAEVRAWSS